MNADNEYCNENNRNISTLYFSWNPKCIQGIKEPLFIVVAKLDLKYKILNIENIVQSPFWDNEQIESIHLKYSLIDQNNALNLTNISFNKLYDKNILNSDKLNQQYSEQGEWDKGFSDHYKLHLKVLVDEFEKERVAAASLARRKLLWLTPLFVVVPIMGWKLLVWEFNRSDDFEGIGFYFLILSFGALKNQS